MFKVRKVVRLVICLLYFCVLTVGSVL